MIHRSLVPPSSWYQRILHSVIHYINCYCVHMCNMCMAVNSGVFFFFLTWLNSSLLLCPTDEQRCEEGSANGCTVLYSSHWLLCSCACVSAHTACISAHTACISANTACISAHTACVSAHTACVSAHTARHSAVHCSPHTQRALLCFDRSLFPLFNVLRTNLPPHIVTENRMCVCVTSQECSICDSAPACASVDFYLL